VHTPSIEVNHHILVIFNEKRDFGTQTIEEKFRVMQHLLSRELSREQLAVCGVGVQHDLYA